MSKGRYGVHGGQYIPETLMNEIINLEKSYEYYKKDPEFNRELKDLLNNYAGRPSLLYYAEKMTKDLGGAKIYLKREDLNHTGSHKINNVLGQVLLAKKMGKTRVIADRGRPARSSDRHCGSAFRYGMRNFHGQRGHGPAGFERLSNGASGSKGPCGYQRHPDSERRSQRDHAGMGRPGS